ncbi:transmembrane protein, putative (macronuclear) [Tetrahymena thermophila SB210]|uniref:Transmembrane protein, putative n=1 Tax=Tetrahymena thermophila (strain SB210) TaxID=312017 RepID=W7XI25_TETTS|nr:transmembrane protein, putative [Tetrahymena thermophila SB210]EWS72909.1 transmembrane protein, putative [Tetrahymena thermophila SB210]|eukprot:XP_012654549.1 transmembrane protein, putative [Tetrahymena thermophila SB210]
MMIIQTLYFFNSYQTFLKILHQFYLKIFIFDYFIFNKIARFIYLFFLILLIMSQLLTYLVSIYIHIINHSNNHFLIQIIQTNDLSIFFQEKLKLILQQLELQKQNYRLTLLFSFIFFLDEKIHLFLQQSLFIILFKSFKILFLNKIYLYFYYFLQFILQKIIYYYYFYHSFFHQIINNLILNNIFYRSIKFIYFYLYKIFNYHFKIKTYSDFIFLQQHILLYKFTSLFLFIVFFNNLKLYFYFSHSIKYFKALKT